MRYLKKFEFFVFENETKEAPTKPKTKPGTRPKPGRPSPIRRSKPGQEPRPKAEVDDVYDLFNYLSSDEDKKEIHKYYEKKKY